MLASAIACGKNMTDEIPQWVRLACKRWGAQKRRIWLGRDYHGNIDGYAQSLLGRIRDEREGASQGVQSQKWPEVYRGDGLEVQRAIYGMPELGFEVLHFQYVWDPRWEITASQKAKILGIGRTEYFKRKDKAEVWVHARLDGCALESITHIAQKRALQSPSLLT